MLNARNLRMSIVYNNKDSMSFSNFRAFSGSRHNSIELHRSPLRIVLNQSSNSQLDWQKMEDSGNSYLVKQVFNRNDISSSIEHRSSSIMRITDSWQGKSLVEYQLKGNSKIQDIRQCI